MDVTLFAARLDSEFKALIEDQDFEGAEELMWRALESHGSIPLHWIHHQLGKLYIRWNKMSSAQHHLAKAAEMAHESSDVFMSLQILDDFKSVRRAQEKQKP